MTTIIAMSNNDNYNGNMSYADENVERHIYDSVSVDNVDHQIKCSCTDTGASDNLGKDQKASKRRVTYMYSNEYTQVCDSMLRIPERVNHYV